MAIFHLTTKPISRGKGQSAIAAAAYRSGERLRDEQANKQKFYASRAERIVSAEIMAPKDAPEWARDRNALWNHAERAETRKDARLAREIEVSLPHELTAQQREWLVKDFVREQFVRKGYAVDIAIHAPDKDSDTRNHHAHLLITERTLGPDGFAKGKDPTMNKAEQLNSWREQWANLANRHLERHGHEARIDHRNLKDQGIEREPTMHVGYAGMEIAARGGQSDRMDALKEIIARNDIRLEQKEIGGELATLEREAAAASVPYQTMHIRHLAAEAEYGQTAAARDLQQERREERYQDAWLGSMNEPNPDKPKEAEPVKAPPTPGIVTEREAPNVGTGKEPDGGGLRVVDSATGAVSKLADFMLDFFGGTSAPAPAPDKSDKAKPDMRAFVSDPAARKEQQIARLAASKAAEADAKAIEQIRRDMEAGRGLRSQDIANLSPTHQHQIWLKGDDGARQMVEEHRKKSETLWKGSERERER